MDSDALLPRTPIEYYVFAGVLVVLNIVVLLATGHNVLSAFAMGAFYGLAMALVVVFLVVAWRVLRGTSEQSDADSAE